MVTVDCNAGSKGYDVFDAYGDYRLTANEELLAHIHYMTRKKENGKRESSGISKMHAPESKLRQEMINRMKLYIE